VRRSHDAISGRRPRPKISDQRSGILRGKGGEGSKKSGGEEKVPDRPCSRGDAASKGTKKKGREGERGANKRTGGVNLPTKRRKKRRAD